MLGKFFYGQLPLRVAFWQFSILGLLVGGFITRLLMTLLKQTMNYDTNFIRVAINSLSFLQNNTVALAYFAFYVAAFIALCIYAVICIMAMWNTYKEYDKSKVLAIICLLIIIALSYFVIKFSIY
jgi:hypothetical protein